MTDSTHSKPNHRIHPLATAIATVCAGTALASPAWAQSEGLMLEEVVVTAQKRSQSVQDVPSTVNALAGTLLEDYTIQDFSELEQVTVGMTLEAKSPRAGSISLRGIDYNPNSAAEQAVDVYWNDTPVRGGGGVFQQLFDLQRIEVLKGPQGTLQGRSSPAGAIMLHTAKPDMEEMEGSISAQVTDNDGINTTAAVSLPIIPGVLSTRFALVYDESDLDQLKNIGTGNKTNKETTAGRFSVAWLASDSLSIDFAYQYLENDALDFSSLQGSPLLDPTLPTLDAFDRKGMQVNDNDFEGEYNRASLKLDWDIGNHQITWLSGYSDIDSVVNKEAPNSEGNLDPAEAQTLIQIDDSDFFSQELRLTNTDGDIWEYMVGIYYSEEDGSFSVEQFAIGSDTESFIADTPFSTESSAVFTHHIIHLSDAWTTQLGLRWQNKKSDLESNITAGAGGFRGIPAGTFLGSLIPEEHQHRDDDSVTGAVNLQYHFDDPDVMVYTSFSTGYRPGGVTVGRAILNDLVAFDEEESWSVELGFKSTLMDGRATLSGAVFYQEFDDYITRLNSTSVSTQPTQAGGITANADAEVTGAEVEFNMLLTENWQLGGGVSYAEAIFADGEELPCNIFDEDGSAVIPPGQTAATCDVGGDALGPQPEWQFGLNSEYTLPFSSFEGYLRGLYKFNGEREDTDIGTLDSYQTFDVYLGARSESRTWDVGLFARNIFDEEEIVRANPAGVHRRQLTGYQAVDLVPQRLLGLKATFRF